MQTLTITVTDKPTQSGCSITLTVSQATSPAVADKLISSLHNHVSDLLHQAKAKFGTHTINT